MYEPAGEVNEVGGDFYEVFRGRGRLGGGARRRLGQGGGRSGGDRRGPAHDPHRRARSPPTRSRGCSCSTATCAGATTSRSARSRWWSSPTPPRPPAQALVYLAGHPHPMLLRAGRALTGRRTRAAARGRRRALLGAGRGRDRARRPARPLHRRGDRGPRRGRRALRRRSPAARPRRLRVPGAGGRAGPHGALALRRPGPRRRRRAGRDPPHRRRRGARRSDPRRRGRRIAGRLARCGPMPPRRKGAPPCSSSAARRSRSSRSHAGGRRRSTVPLVQLAEPVAGHLRDRAVRGPVRGPVSDPYANRRRARGRRALGARAALVGCGRGGGPRSVAALRAAVAGSTPGRSAAQSRSSASARRFSCSRRWCSGSSAAGRLTRQSVGFPRPSGGSGREGEPMRAAAIQLNSTAEKARNLERAARLVAAAAAAGARARRPAGEVEPARRRRATCSPGPSRSTAGPSIAAARRGRASSASTCSPAASPSAPRARSACSTPRA